MYNFVNRYIHTFQITFYVLKYPYNKFKCNIVHCEWSDWEVTDCDKSCGGGTLTETRTVTVEAQHGGEECTGESSITKSCNVQECPGNRDTLNHFLFLFYSI